MPPKGSEDYKSLFAQMTGGKISFAGMSHARMNNPPNFEPSAEFVVTSHDVVQGLMTATATLPDQINR